jgi:hypothetical protein
MSRTGEEHIYRKSYFARGPQSYDPAVTTVATGWLRPTASPAPGGRGGVLESGLLREWARLELPAIAMRVAGYGPQGLAGAGRGSGARPGSAAVHRPRAERQYRKDPRAGAVVSGGGLQAYDREIIPALGYVTA